METSSNVTASATTQFAQSLIPETFREKPALARSIRRIFFAVRSLAGGICGIGAPGQMLRRLLAEQALPARPQAMEIEIAQIAISSSSDRLVAFFATGRVCRIGLRRR